MKKLVLSAILFLLINSMAYSKPAVLDLNNLTLNFQCLRAVNCEGISENNCYGLILKYIDPDFIIQNFSSIGNLPKEADDQTFNCETLELNIPYIEVGNNAYSVKLKFHRENGHITIEEAGKVDNGNSNNNGNDKEITGNCFFNTAELTKQNFCITYYGEKYRTYAENACKSLKGVWTPNERCEAGDLGSCMDINDNGVLHDVDYYDAGIIDLAHLAGQDASFITGDLMEDCNNQNGIWFYSDK